MASQCESNRIATCIPFPPREQMVIICQEVSFEGQVFSLQVQDQLNMLGLIDHD